MNSKQRRKDRRFKVETVRGFIESMSQTADVWEAKEMTAAEIIAEVRHQSAEAQVLLEEARRPKQSMEINNEHR